MSTISSQLICKQCSRPLPADALECEACHGLVHSEELNVLASEARSAEAKRDFPAAHEKWRRALSLLPPESRQAEWIRNRARALDVATEREQATSQHRQWGRKIGPLAPIAILLAKSKALLMIFKLPFLLSLVAFMGVYWAEFGPRFGIGFAALILIHEMGHFIDIKRRGLPADMPVFLPGLGAYVRWQALGVSAETRAAVRLAGPLTGAISAAFCALVWWINRDPLWAALARAGAWLNVLNLIPVWILDGSQAIIVLSKLERLAVLSLCLVMWLYAGENVFVLVAAGTGWRLFTKDIPEPGSRVTALYFLTLLTCLGTLMRLLPGRGFGPQ